MKKIWNFILKNRIYIVLIIFVLFCAFIFVTMKAYLDPVDEMTVYGNRLDGINKVKISNETYESVKKEVEDTELVEKVETRLQGKIVYTTIELKDGITVEKAKEIATNTLDNYSEDELKYYDFSFFLKWKGEEEDTVITGNKHHNLDSITWVKS